MFGKNVVRHKSEYDPTGRTLRVQSVFNTIQGEGPYSGCPAVFVRMAGCNLRCHFCDTDFESQNRPVEVHSLVEEVCSRVVEDKRARPRLVVITGGEPLLQNIFPLCNELVLRGLLVQIETAGTVWPEGEDGESLENLAVEGKVVLVCSPKTPEIHPVVERRCSHWKYLIRSNETSPVDGLPERSTQIPGRLSIVRRPPRATDEVWLQPCEEYRDTAVLQLSRGDEGEVGSDALMRDQMLTSQVRDEQATRLNLQECVRLAMQYNYRISIQLHKILGLP